MQTTLFVDPDLGRVFVPESLKRLISVPGLPTRFQHPLREIGINTMKAKRPRYRCGERSDRHNAAICGDPNCLIDFELMVAGISHNERLAQGAVAQDALLFAAGTTRFLVVAIANAALTKGDANLSLGSNSANVTTNEFTTLGLTRVLGAIGSYTAPASIGLVFTRRVTKVLTATGGATAKGSGLYDSVTVSGSTLFVEDNHTDAVLVTNDTLTENWDYSD